MNDLDWQHILWREWHHCNDAAYKNQLALLLIDTRKPVRLGDRPMIFDIESALQIACQKTKLQTRAWRNALNRLQESYRDSFSVDRLIKSLQRHQHWSRAFVNRHLLVRSGGDAVPALVKLADGKDEDVAETVAETARWLLENIALDTTNRLQTQAQTYLCEDCLVSFKEYEVSLGYFKSISYYACRICEQSWRVVKPAIKTIAVLDSEWSADVVRNDTEIRVNVLRTGKLFECDQLEIIRATDRDVERFVMQVQNDTDILRQAHYRAAPYRLEPTLNLSENSLRLLNDTFGRRIRDSEREWLEIRRQQSWT